MTERFPSESDTPSEYDLVLAALPVPLVGGVITGFLSAVSVVAAVGVGSLLAFVVLAYTLFLAPPV